MAAPFVRLDASLYVRMPKLNARSAAALARQLIVALPKGSPEGVKHAARQMRADAEALREAQLVARQAAIEERPTRNVRQVDNEADSLFATLLRRLEDYQALAGHDDPTATSAAALSAALFPNRIAFTTGDVLTQWEATEEWFKVLATEQREATLRALVGGGFIDALRAVHAEYGLVTGTTQPAVEKPAKVELGAALQRPAREPPGPCAAAGGRRQRPERHGGPADGAPGRRWRSSTGSARPTPDGPARAQRIRRPIRGPRRRGEAAAHGVIARASTSLPTFPPKRLVGL